MIKSITKNMMANTQRNGNSGLDYSVGLSSVYLV